MVSWVWHRREAQGSLGNVGLCIVNHCDMCRHELCINYVLMIFMIFMCCGYLFFLYLMLIDVQSLNACWMPLCDNMWCTRGMGGRSMSDIFQQDCQRLLLTSSQATEATMSRNALFYKKESQRLFMTAPAIWGNHKGIKLAKSCHDKSWISNQTNLKKNHWISKLLKWNMCLWQPWSGQGNQACCKTCFCRLSTACA